MLLINEAEFDKQVGARLREARTRAGVRVETLSTNTALSEATVRAHERGTRSISAVQALEYALLLAVTPGWLLFGELAQGEKATVAPDAPETADPAEQRSWRPG